MSARDHDRGQRWASILACLGVVGLVGWMTYEQAASPRMRRDDAAALGDAGAGEATATSAGDESARADGGTEAIALADEATDDGGSSPLLALDLGDAAALPSGAPRTVRVGLVFVQWKGAEGATTSTRPKGDALAKAQELAAQAKEDFRRAVTQGDPGSAEDIGRIPRGTLDPRTEAVLFNLAPGAVSEAIETPRGYWIVKRID